TPPLWPFADRQPGPRRRRATDSSERLAQQRGQAVRVAMACLAGAVVDGCLRRRLGAGERAAALAPARRPRAGDAARRSRTGRVADDAVGRKRSPRVLAVVDAGAAGP